jgi:signal transduction histidine kinase
VYTSKDKRIPLLQYWTARYLITLFIGIFIIGLLSTLWIKYSTTQKRLDSIQALAAEIAESSIDANGALYIDPRISRDIERRQKYLNLGPALALFVVDKQGQLIYARPGTPTPELLQGITIPAEQEQGVQELKSSPDAHWYVAKQAIKNGDRIMGSIYVVYPLRDINRNPQEIQLLVFMLGGIGILGWIIIYALTRQLAKPVKDVAEAAKQIVTGNYDLHLDANVREQEIYELIESFKEMAERLRHLEALRTELLAGVTHELKTPLTSISGLLQALKDRVVKGGEAREFIEICHSETARLQKMVEDLLDFNAFVTGDIKVEKDAYNINKLVREISYQWLIAQEEGAITLNTRVPEYELMAMTDAMRLQQILYNLFNNAQQAINKQGSIEVSVYEQDSSICIDVKDDGPGIAGEEQDLIFERFFRGHDKKLQVHGLGLGLSFSRMIARALGGDLLLKSSSAQGTAFTLLFTKEDTEKH